jgi:RNA polymerase sigma-70 factor (ECF subfamily)
MGETFSTLSAEQLRGHASWLRRLALALVRDEATADDLVQSTLLAAVRRPPELSRDLRPWFERVLRNFARESFRARTRRERRELHFHTAAAELPDAEELLTRHEAARLVAALVSELREPSRSTVLLHFAEGVQLKDIAERQGVPAGTVRRRLKDALDQLRGRLDDHYRAQRRDWRAMLLPLGHLGGGRRVAVKGVMLMSAKAKIAVVVGAALALYCGVHFWPGRTERSALVTPSAAVPAAGLAQAGRGAARLPSPPPRSAPPPSFAAAGRALADLPSCERELERLRHERDDNPQLVSMPAGDAVFEQMKPSPQNQRILAPIIDRILSGFQPRPEYTLDCRVSRCRLTLLAPEGGRAEPWLKAVEGDDELTKKLTSGGGRLGWAVSSRKVKDALSGKDAIHSQLFFTVPASKTDKDHPFDVGEDVAAQAAPLSLAACRDRVTALRQQLDVSQQQVEKDNDPRALSAKNFLAARPSPELTSKFRGVVAALVASGALPAGTSAECRGDSDCQLSFSTPVTSKGDDGDDRAEHALLDKLGQLLGEQGYTSHGTQVRKSLSQDNEHPESAHADTSILMRLEPNSAAKAPG